MMAMFHGEQRTEDKLLASGEDIDPANSAWAPQTPSTAFSASASSASPCPTPTSPAAPLGGSIRPQIIYALVASREKVLVEHTGRDVDSGQQSYSGNFRQFTMQLVQRLDKNVEWKSYVCGDQAFHCIVGGGNWFVCMAETSMGRRIPYAFLQALQDAFELRGFETQDVDPANLCRVQEEFSPQMQLIMERFNSPNADRAACIAQKVQTINDCLMESIDRILERQERIELLVQKSEELRTDSVAFRTAARQVRRRVWWRHKRTIICLTLVVLIVIVLCLMSQCGFKFDECGF